MFCLWFGWTHAIGGGGAQVLHEMANVPDFYSGAPKVFAENRKTLNGRLPLEDSSDFDDPVLVLIVMMRSIV